MDKFKKTKETMDEAIELLKDHGMCLITRPTGFGKSYILSHIASLYEHIIYFYPRDIIKLDVNMKYKAVLKNLDIKFITYQMMVYIWKNDNISSSEYFQNIQNNERTLFIFDECHLTGGHKISRALDDLIDIYPKAHILGATATPNRSDYFNVRYHFFDGIETSPYGISDCIKDGIFKKPYYVIGTFAVSTNYKILKKRAMDLDIPKDRKQILLNTINNSEIKYLNLYNEADVIKNAINTAEHNTEYMKYICFFPDMATLYSKIDRIKDNFKSIFPTHIIREYVVLSDKSENKDNLKKIQKIRVKKNTIDLIFAVDMLSMGYHVSNVNGIIMYRNTSSDIIYIQQIGRCISVDSEIQPIIFDFVGNHLKHTFDSGNISVISQSRNNKSADDINVFGEEDVNIIDNLREFTEIERLIDAEEIIDLEDAIIDAYLHKNAPIKYCMHELKMTEDAFLKLVKKKGENIL